MREPGQCESLGESRGSARAESGGAVQATGDSQPAPTPAPAPAPAHARAPAPATAPAPAPAPAPLKVREPGSLHVRLTTADSTVAAVDPNDLYAEFKASGACPFNFDDLPDGSKERIYQVWFDTRTHAGINTKFAEYGLRSAGAAFDPKAGRRILARTQQSGPKGPKAGRHQYGHNHELVSGDAKVQLEEQLGMLQDNPPRMDEGDKYLDWERAVAETEEALHASLVPDTVLH